MRPREEIEKEFLTRANKKLFLEAILDIRDIMADFLYEYMDDKYDECQCDECKLARGELYEEGEEDIEIEPLTEEEIEELIKAERKKNEI